MKTDQLIAMLASGAEAVEPRAWAMPLLPAVWFLPRC
jgi:hypothetical protein